MNAPEQSNSGVPEAVFEAVAQARHERLRSTYGAEEQWSRPWVDLSETTRFGVVNAVRNEPTLEQDLLDALPAIHAQRDQEWQEPMGAAEAALAQRDREVRQRLEMLERLGMHMDPDHILYTPPPRSTHCKQGAHALCGGKAGIEKRCACICHRQTSAAPEGAALEAAAQEFERRAERIWIVRKLESGEFTGAYWQRPAPSAEEAVRCAVQAGALGSGTYLASPEPGGNGAVFFSMPMFTVKVESAIHVRGAYR